MSQISFKSTSRKARLRRASLLRRTHDGVPTTVHPRQRSHDGAPTTAWRHQCAARWHVCAGVCRKHRSVFASHAAVAGGYSHYNWKAFVRLSVVVA